MNKDASGHIKPTEFELELLRLLWTRESATIRDLHEMVSRYRKLGYTTVLKTMQIMYDKGLVVREEAGKAHVYRASQTEEQTRHQLLGDLSERLFGGSAGQLVLHALAADAVTTQELKQIKALISQKERQK